MMKKTMQILATVPFLHVSLEAADREIEQITPPTMLAASADELHNGPMKMLLQTRAFAIDATKSHHKFMLKATIGFSDIQIADFAATLNKNEQKLFGTMTNGWEIANITIALTVFSGFQIDQIAHELREHMSIDEKIEIIKRFERELAK